MEIAYLQYTIKERIANGFFPTEASGGEMGYYIECRKISPLRNFLFELLPDYAKHFFYTSRKGGEFFSPLQSAKCLDDGKRTAIFYKAVQKACRQALANKSGETINVLDAGCGAFPILSIAAALASPLVKVQAIEGSSLSCDIATGLIKRLSLDQQIRVINADATNFIPETEFDVLVSETMFSGLLDEPIAQIMFYLKRFTRPGGFLLPESCEIKLATTNHLHPDVSNEEKAIVIANKFYKKIDREFYLDKVVKHSFGTSPKLVAFNVRGRLPGLPYIASPVKVFDDLQLDIYDSLITAPVPLVNINYIFRYGGKTEIRYAMGDPYILEEQAVFY